MTAAHPLPSTVGHLDALTATGAEGWLVVSTPTPDGWRSRSFATDDVDAAARYGAELDQGGHNVYVRSTLLARPLAHERERGGASDTGAAVALAVDLDVAGPGHKQGAAGLPLPPNLEAAMAIVDELPPPSLHIDTGGGVHLWWILDEPEHDDPVTVLHGWADRIVEAGARRGFHVDRPDPARVLRLCGTHRRKPGIPENLVTLTDVAGWPIDGMASRPWCPGSRYGARELLEALPPPAPAAPPPAPRHDRRPGEIGPADAVSQLSWAQILEPLRWTFEGMGTVDGAPVELWRRPGATSPYSAKCSPDGWAVAWSDASGLPAGAGHRLNRWRVYVALHHHGDEVGAARSIRARSKEVTR